MKEECIRTITREQKDIVSKADVYALRITELERERGELADRVQQQQQQPVQAEVRAVHQQYQEKMRRVQVRRRA